MGITSKPVVFAVLSAAVILIGTTATVFIPLFMPSTQPVSAYIKPYTAVEQRSEERRVGKEC